MAILLATKFSEGVAQNAGTSAWSVITRLRERVAAKFQSDENATAALTRLQGIPTESDRSVIASRVTAAAQADPRFRAEIEQLLAIAQQDRVAGSIVAQAYDNAKQVNLHGNNHGTINL